MFTIVYKAKSSYLRGKKRLVYAQTSGKAPFINIVKQTLGCIQA